ncbi:MAG: SBBP repeat-containing protein [Microcoleus sp.]|uniref:SBBP repeat-containing protein n=1 Tax=Microcoleus sp. TaxID=44472 RepID=UPI0035242569
MTQLTSNFEWLKQFGTPGGDSLRDTVFDSAGNLYLIGEAYGLFGGTNPSSNSWITKYDAGGNQLWSVKQLTNRSSSKVTVDSAGNVYVAGTTNTTKLFEQKDAWVAKYDSTGNQLWLEEFNFTKYDEYPYDIAVDNAGNVYLTGTEGFSSISRTPGLRRTWIAKYDGSGNQLWLKKVESGSDDKFPIGIAGTYPYGIKVDSSGNLYVVGKNFNRYVNLSLPPPADGNTWATKYDSNGNQLWFQQFGTAVQWLSGLALDSANNLYLMGALADTNASNLDIWTAKYDSNGERLWVQQFGSREDDYPSELVVDSAGNLYLTGITKGDLGSPNAGNLDIWAAKYDSNGDRLWLQQFGSRENDSPSDLVVDNAGNLYLTGKTNDALAGPYTGSTDIWATKYDSNGDRLWFRQFGTEESGETFNLELDRAGNVYLIGDTKGSLGGPNAGSQDIWLAKPSTSTEEVTPTPIIGTDGDDFLAGNRSNDTISGKQGNDTIIGFDGSDRMYGDLGNDFLDGSQKDDTLYGGKGNDTLLGGNGEDVLMGDRGSDSLVGGEGNDTLYGGKGNDTLLGGNGEDVLMGDRGSDILNGGDGNDILLGGKGDDVLMGGLGDDTLTGGNGSDRFLLSANSGADTITDFEYVKDSLSLNNGLNFFQLSITQENNATFIRLSATGEILASLNGVTASLINAADFNLG